jgi:hypothetical protein
MNDASQQSVSSTHESDLEQIAQDRLAVKYAVIGGH